jgi:hypothetical protein
VLVEMECCRSRGPKWTFSRPLIDHRVTMYGVVCSSKVVQITSALINQYYCNWYINSNLARKISKKTRYFKQLRDCDAPKENASFAMWDKSYFYSLSNNSLKYNVLISFDVNQYC